MSKKKKNLPKKKIWNYQKKVVVDAPYDMCLLGDNIAQVLIFFRELKSEKNWLKTRNGKSKVDASLKKVEKIDYATISVMTALAENFKKESVEFSFSPPENRVVRRMLFNSGMLNHFYDEYGNRIKNSVRGELINLKNGCGILKASEIGSAMESIKKMFDKINYPNDKYMVTLKTLRTVILEICGNAIEWGYGKKEKKWILGVYKASADEIVVSFTDIGDGILKTLNRKLGDVIFDAIRFNGPVDVLKRAFERKYGSSTREPNRNRGLPMIKKKLTQLNVSNFKVLSNDALLDFTSFTKSKNLKDLHANFHGTLYQWSITNDGNQN